MAQRVRLRKRITGPASSFDPSAYRETTYGVSSLYCDATRSTASNGAGTLGDPWNLVQAMQSATAGQVVRFLPLNESMNGSFVSLPEPNSVQTAAFTPTNDGTSGNRIVFVTKWAATALDRDTITSNGNRTEIRHAGTPAVAAGPSETGTGGPAIGSNNRDYITFDGFFLDVSQAEIKGDSGILQPRDCIGVHFRNFVIKGKTVNCQSNAVLYRPHNAQGTILSNFRAYDFANDWTNSDDPQPGLFSASYGDQDFLIEHFDIDNCQGGGIFCKGTTTGPVFNYGTIQYGIVRNTGRPFMFNDLHGTNPSFLRYCLAYNTVASARHAADGILLHAITTAVRNLTVDHCTVAKVDSTDSNLTGAMAVQNLGITSGVTLTNNLLDIDSGTYGNMMVLLATAPAAFDRNFYYKNGSTEPYAVNGSPYTSFSAYRTAVQALTGGSGLEANSVEGASGPFMDRANDDYRISGGHAAATLSTTGGPVGCFDENNYTIGVVT